MDEGRTQQRRLRVKNDRLLRHIRSPLLRELVLKQAKICQMVAPGTTAASQVTHRRQNRPLGAPKRTTGRPQASIVAVGGH